jgi:hypothetical protein
MQPLIIFLNGRLRAFCARHSTAFALGAALAALALISGCSNFDSPPGRYLAKVTVKDANPGDVELATVEVFRNHYFQGGLVAPGQFVFSRAGSRTDDILFGSYFLNPTVSIRVSVVVTPLTGGGAQVGCNAVTVRDAGSLAEDSQRVTAFGKGPYQKLLDEIPAKAAQIKQATGQ